MSKIVIATGLTAVMGLTMNTNDEAFQISEFKIPPWKKVVLVLATQPNLEKRKGIKQILTEMENNAKTRVDLKNIQDLNIQPFSQQVKKASSAELIKEYSAPNAKNQHVLQLVLKDTKGKKWDVAQLLGCYDGEEEAMGHDKVTKTPSYVPTVLIGGRPHPTVLIGEAADSTSESSGVKLPIRPQKAVASNDEYAEISYSNIGPWKKVEIEVGDERDHKKLNAIQKILRQMENQRQEIKFEDIEPLLQPETQQVTKAELVRMRHSEPHQRDLLQLNVIGPGMKRPEEVAKLYGDKDEEKIRTAQDSEELKVQILITKRRKTMFSVSQAAAAARELFESTESKLTRKGLDTTQASAIRLPSSNLYLSRGNGKWSK